MHASRSTASCWKRDIRSRGSHCHVDALSVQRLWSQSVALLPVRVSHVMPQLISLVARRALSEWHCGCVCQQVCVSAHCRVLQASAMRGQKLTWRNISTQRLFAVPRGARSQPSYRMHTMFAVVITCWWRSSIYTECDMQMNARFVLRQDMPSLAGAANIH